MDRRQALLGQFLSAAAIMVVVGWTVASPAFADDVGASKSELIRGLLPTVVNISVRKEEPASPTAATVSAAAPTASPGPAIKSFVGSGFVIDPSGLIVTNYHVVEDAFEVTVTFSDGTRLLGKTMSASRIADLALVKVEADHPLTAAHWGNSDSLQVGDQVFAAGDPFGIGLSVSAGIVSGLNRDIQDSPYDHLIQTDAAINHGNSGGPLFDMQGNVVGVDSDIISPTYGSSGIGFAIPSSTAHFVVDQLRTYGWVHPGWIGVKVQTVTREIADAMGMARPEGSIVSWVLPDGPAKKAGLAIGDVILRYGGSTLSDERALLRDIARTPVGNTITLIVRHDGNERSVPITIEAWPRSQWDARDAPIQVQRPKITIPPDLGLSLAALATDEKAKLGLEDGLDGVLVTSVAPNSDSARRGMVSGDVILRVQDKPVTRPAEVQSGVNAARASKHDFVLMLVLPKARDVPGPKWVALQLDTAGG
ncbi:MAG: trypsin-like peptidase domain-containing protein [Rhodopila sp.]|nr:trypsin-like peptidase domain-containing protein [Rhodopila sp.]